MSKASPTATADRRVADACLPWSASVPGEPVGKGRPRITVRGGFAHAYTPDATARWEKYAALQLSQKWGARPAIRVPVEVSVLAYASRPKRLRGKASPDGPLWRPHKPDADNILKAALDALVKAGVIEDDALAVDVRCRSMFVQRDGDPMVSVAVMQATPESSP